MVQGRGGGKTPEMVVEIVKAVVAEKGQSAFSRESGIGRLVIQRILKGVGEPTKATLDKLSKCLGYSVSELMGYGSSGWIKENTRTTGNSPNTLNFSKLKQHGGETISFDHAYTVEDFLEVTRHLIRLWDTAQENEKKAYSMMISSHLEGVALYLASYDIEREDRKRLLQSCAALADKRTEAEKS